MNDATAFIPLLAERAYRPFLDPLSIDAYWMLLLVPLVVVISVVYKTIKLEDLTLLPRQAAWLSAQIVAFMGIAAVVLWCVTEWM